MSGDHNQYQESAPYDMKECGTCGYPLLPEERTSLVEANGKMAKPWANLTDEEIDHIWGITPPDYVDKFALPRMIEAKLKEKNI